MEPVKEVSFERVLDAPVDVVWKAWTDPAMIREWWGPDNVTIPECEIDLRVGGKIYIVMEAGEGMGPHKGVKWPMLGTFTAVEPNRHLAYRVKAWTEGAHETTEIDQETVLTLVAQGDKTKLSLKAVIHKVGPNAGGAVQGMQYGFTQQLAKLDKFLAAAPR